MAVAVSIRAGQVPRDKKDVQRSRVFLAGMGGNKHCEHPDMRRLNHPAMWCGLLFVALAAPLQAAPEMTDAQWEAELARAQSLIQARTKEVRDLRKATDKLVAKLDSLKRNNVAKLTPEFKHQMALQRIEYYNQLGTLNSAINDMERTLPGKVAPLARQKVMTMLATLRGELRYTVVSLNHVAKSLKEL